jgi:hypothetical protein
MTKLTESVLKEFDKVFHSNFSLVNQNGSDLRYVEIRSFLQKALSKLEKEKVGTCEWKVAREKGYVGWRTSCDNEFMYLYKIYKYCPLCGKKIVETK